MINCRLPYFEERTVPIDTIVLHCFAYDVDKGIQTFHQAGVSAHYMIGLNGKIYKLVDEDKCAWHAGKSFWRGRESLNRNSIGIEVCSPTLGQEPYNFRQIASLLRLCRRLIRRYHIKPQNIVGHSDIAPTRKPDPGRAFPWAYLARHGVGLWYRLEDIGKNEECDAAKMLAAIGYDISDLHAAKWAFCRHFFPQIVPVNDDVMALINQPYPKEDLSDTEAFIKVLKAVHYRFLR